MAVYQFERKPVLHYGIKGEFKSKEETVSIRISGRTQFIFYIDGVFCGDGPSRFTADYPQYTTHTFSLEAGKHTLSVLYQYIDMETRITDNQLDPFFFCEMIGEDGRAIEAKFAYTPLSGYDEHLGFRVAPTLGLLEWCADSSSLNAFLNGEAQNGWQEMEPSFGLTVYEDPTRPVLALETALMPDAQGMLSEEFGYERDCAAARFFLRELDDLKVPAQGIYRRYDMGSVKLVRPCFTLDLPKGATVEIGISEQLAHGRVNPFLSLTGGLGTNLVHYKAAGGKQTFMPLNPLGGRYIELHVVCEQQEVDQIKLLEEKYYWRTFFDKEPASFSCDNNRLNDIWNLSVQTLRSCTEDVVTDCPVRERGQWTGDCSVVGLRTTSIAYGDMQVIKKSLIQAAALPDKNGVIPALFPGQSGYFVTYSLLWVAGLMDYVRYCGDQEVLVKTYPAAERFMDFMARSFNKEDGTMQQNGVDIDYGFIDWGYELIGGTIVLPVVGMYAMALKAFSEIKVLLGLDTKENDEMLTAVMDVMRREADKKTPEELGYHAVVLLLKTGVFAGEKKDRAISYIKNFVMGCFPNKKDAERLYSPTIFLKNIITPYFYNFTLWALIENGEAEFAYQQIESCWGYMLDNGDATCLEVFDHRWSHCHQWSGCPGWILSCYGLGLFKRYDLGERHFEFDLEKGSMKYASGSIPLSDGSMVHVNWEGTKYVIEPEKDIWIHKDGAVVSCPAGQKTEWTI